jgi:hypothetical protein
MHSGSTLKTACSLLALLSASCGIARLWLVYMSSQLHVHSAARVTSAMALPMHPQHCNVLLSPQTAVVAAAAAAAAAVMAAEAARTLAGWAMQACCLRSCCSSAGAAAAGSPPPEGGGRRRRRCRRQAHSPRCRLPVVCSAHARCQSCCCWRCYMRWRATRHAGRRRPCCCHPPRRAQSRPGRLTNTTNLIKRDQISVDPGTSRQACVQQLCGGCLKLQRNATPAPEGGLTRRSRRRNSKLL